jgi:hypothetical protein
MLGQPAVARKVSQILRCAELDTQIVQDLKQLGAAMAQHAIPQPKMPHAAPPLVCLGGADLSAALTSPHPANFIAFVDESEPNIFSVAQKDPRVLGVLGVPVAGAAPRAWELLAAASRYSRATMPIPSSTLSWGHTWHERRLRSSAERRAMVDVVERFSGELLTSRQAQGAAQLADELIMNAMYDAPLDHSGRQRYAHRRREPIELEPAESPTFGFGSDGARIVISASDPFGHLKREHVFGGIHRGLTTGSMDTSGGGAGLGMLLIHNTAKVLFVDVLQRQATQFTAVIELDVSTDKVRKQPGSVYFFNH